MRLNLALAWYDRHRSILPYTRMQRAIFPRAPLTITRDNIKDKKSEAVAQLILEIIRNPGFKSVRDRRGTRGSRVLHASRRSYRLL